MDKQKVDLFLLTKQKYFGPEHLPYIRERLMQLDEDQFLVLNGIELMDPTVLLLVSIFGGYLGIDRFLLGNITMGVLKLITAGGCGIWTVVDWFQIQDKARQKNFDTLAQFFSILS
nr:TM2 domain-containing protein [uncultured Porphyromonas sp.]